MVHIPFGAPDYIAHGTSYALFGVLLVRALADGNLADMTGASILPAVAFGVAFGMTDEFHQWFVPGRVASGTDLAADALGSFVGAVSGAAAGALVRGFRRRQSRGYNLR